MENPTPARRRLCKASRGISLPALSPKIEPSEGFRGKFTTTISWTPHTGHLTWEASLRTLGKRVPPPPMGLAGSPCSTFDIWKNGIAFLTELFNLSITGIDIPAIWKNSVFIPILKAGKLWEQGRTPATQSRSSARQRRSRSRQGVRHRLPPPPHWDDPPLPTLILPGYLACGIPPR